MPKFNTYERKWRWSGETEENGKISEWDDTASMRQLWRGGGCFCTSESELWALLISIHALLGKLLELWTSVFSNVMMNRKVPVLHTYWKKRNKQCMKSTWPSASHIIAKQTITIIVILILGSLTYLLSWLPTFSFTGKRYWIWLE